MSRASIKQFHSTLQHLGFTSYAEYLQSEHWKDVKTRYRASKMPKYCKVCKAPYQVLHHRTYERLGAERLHDLIPLCHLHHKQLHVREDRLSKRGLTRETRKALTGLRKNNKLMKGHHYYFNGMLQCPDCGRCRWLSGLCTCGAFLLGPRKLPYYVDKTKRTWKIDKESNALLLVE